MIPILINHNDGIPPIGKIDLADGTLVVTFTPEANITREMFFNTFGNCGFEILETCGEVILKARIFEFSLDR
jgi:hypothetical protein